jgi:large subunit ribosomal protein L1
MSKGDKAKEASDAGADIVGDQDLADSISDGKIEFDLLIATPDMMPTVGKIGKILGPKGLMPNPKLGTVTQDVKTAILNAKSGQVQYRNDKAGIVHAGIGKLNFAEEDLLENLKEFYTSISKNKPETVKGSFIKKVSIASTMGVGLKINLTSLR